MRKALIIAGNVLLRAARDRKGLIITLLMPMVLILILGLALNGLMTAGQINPIPVRIINADQPAQPPVPPGTPVEIQDQLPTLHFGRTLAEDVLGSDRVQEVITAAPSTNLEQAKAAVANGDAVAAIYVPPGFTAGALSGAPEAIQLFSDPGAATSAEIVRQVVEAFTEQLTATLLASRQMGQAELEALAAEPAARVRAVSTGLREVSAMQYYAAAMAVMYMVFTAVGRAKDLILEQASGTLPRMLTTPTGRGTVLAGQMLGTGVVVMAQFLVLAAGTRILYQVNWGPWLPALLLGAAFSLAMSGFSAALASLLKDTRAADHAIGVIGTLFAAVSGGMFPLYLFPNGLKLVAKAVPNYWALQGFIDQMAGLGTSQLWLPLTVLCLIGLATGTAGAWRLAYR